jgi:hypothetical protein
MHTFRRLVAATPPICVHLSCCVLAACSRDKWDQTCRQSNATNGGSATQNLTSQSLRRAPIQQGAPGDGVAFMMMHRHMIMMLKTTFPKHTKLFDGFGKVPKTTQDPQNPTPWRSISWTSSNLTGFDTLENLEQHLDMFPSEDDLGQYIENTYRWTAQTPMSPVNQLGSGLHGALHSQWSVAGSPANLIQQSVDVKNYTFWKLHGWIDNVWERYRKAKNLKDDAARSSSGSGTERRATEVLRVWCDRTDVQRTTTSPAIRGSLPSGSRFPSRSLCRPSASSMRRVRPSGHRS